MGKASFAVLGAILVGLAAPASGADVDGRFAVKGAGQLTCDDLALARAETDSLQRILFLGWLQGYFTAVNVYEPETYDVLPWGPSGLLEAIVGTYCENNPDELFYLAAQRAVEALRPTRLFVRSERVQAGGDDEGTRLYVDILQRAQAALSELGLYDGVVDGAFGPKTSEAVSTFQEQEGLEVTGIPDPSTLWALLNPLEGTSN